MLVGVQLPHNEIEVDAGALRELAQGVQDLGFHHVQLVDHVVGADPVTYADRSYLPYDADSVVHEPLTLFGFLAACAPELHLFSAVLVLPQRQTALVAKQMAEIDLLTNGKLRMGVGVGWNDVEYEALGMNFRTRGRRIEEQVGLLRQLWTEPVVTFDGEFDRMRAVSVNPPPVQRPIPIWFGGSVERARRRAAVLGDGLVMQLPLPDLPLESAWPETMDEMRRWRREAGVPGEVGFEARLTLDLARSPDEWVTTAAQWQGLGASHIGVRTTRLGIEGVEAHLARLALASEALADFLT
ncbi:MAG TPA: LLM class F420-dependent oxidoreductase [Gaiellaceae bacterium]|nr:LLM class F420-dependent oxidoreductase [Gaiellaceae bacterium]